MRDKKAEAEILFLAEFRNGLDTKWFNDKDYYKTQIYSGYLGNLKKQFESLKKDKLIDKMTNEQIVDYNYKLVELKNECKIRGLKVSGKKEELVKRILESDPTFVNTCNIKDDLWICTDKGREIVTAYYDEEKQREEVLREKVFDMLRAGKYKQAAEAVEKHRNQRIFPDWWGDPGTLSLTPEIERIKIIWKETPKSLKLLSSEYLEEARLLVSYDFLRGTNLIRNKESKKTNIEGLTIGNAMQILMLYSSGKTHLEEWKKVRSIKGVHIEGVSHETELCPECKKITGKVYAINKVPVIPNEKCNKSVPCPLIYFADMDEEPKKKGLFGLFG